MVRGEGLCDAELSHDRERNAIGHGPFFVGPRRIQTHSRVIEGGLSGDNHGFGIAPQLAVQPYENFPVVDACQPIGEFDHYIFRCNNAAIELFNKAFGGFVKMVARADNRHVEGCVGEQAHYWTFGAPYK